VNRYKTVHTIERQMERAESRWRRARLARNAGAVATVFFAVLLILAFILSSGAVASMPLAVGLHLLTLVGFGIALGFAALLA
jgi:hypothetical protein